MTTGPGVAPYGSSYFDFRQPYRHVATLDVLTHLPEIGEQFEYDGWQFEIVDMDGRKIDRLLASQERRQAEAQDG